MFELTYSCVIGAPRADVWRCWTEPALLARWFHPPGWTTEVVALELVPGGETHLVMRGPDGQESDGCGVVLEVVPDERLVFTNAFTAGWMPAALGDEPMRTMVIALADQADGTRYCVTALHWTEAGRERHAMGFQDGWSTTATQLEALARSLA